MMYMACILCIITSQDVVTPVIYRSFMNVIKLGSDYGHSCVFYKNNEAAISNTKHYMYDGTNTVSQYLIKCLYIEPV